MAKSRDTLRVPSIPPLPALRRAQLPKEHLAHNEILRTKKPFEVRLWMKNFKHRHLYKYMRFDSASSDCLRNLRTVLVDSKLYLSCPEKCNDPFEFHYRLHLDNDPVAVRRELALLHKKTYSRYKMHAKEREREVTKLMQGIRSKVAAGLMPTNSKNHGIYCFAPNPKDLLMWAHYGDSHAGVCVQFRTSMDPATFLTAQPVDYSDNYPLLRWPSVPTDDMKAVMMRKGMAWKYEAERRIVMLGISDRHLDLRSEAVTGLILGSRFPDQHLPAILELLAERQAQGHPQVKLYRASTHKTAYRLSVHGQRAPEP